MKNIMIVDFSNLLYASYYINAGRLDSEFEFIDFFRYHLLLSIKNLKEKIPGDVHETILACDSSSWRKNIFKEYKMKRKQNQDKNKKIQNMFELTEKLYEEFENELPFSLIREYGAEADDIIATLIFKKFGLMANDYNVYIMSTDKDFFQLQKYKNVKQYSPLTKKWVTKDVTPEHYIKEHVLIGDVGDGVPNLLSDNDSLINTNKRQRRITAKVKREFFNDIDDYVIKNNLISNFKRNQQMVILDSEQIPDDIQDKIMFAYNTNLEKVAKNNKYDVIWKYFSKHNIKALQDEVHYFLNKIELQNNNGIKKTDLQSLFS